MNKIYILLSSIMWKIRRNPIPVLKEKSNNGEKVKYAKKDFLSTSDINEYIKKCIIDNKPTMIARFGANEFYTMWTKEFSYNSKFTKSINTMYMNAGFFPKDINLLKDFADLMIEERNQVDYLAVWNLKLEREIIKNKMNCLKGVFALEDIEPWYSEKPWTESLKDKKVLVVHPFAETILRQYKRKDEIFQCENILPNFELRVVKAIQSIAGESDNRFENWFDAFEYMYDECMREDFDVAIIGCGAYGFPLAARLKKEGKIAIHMGGSTQLLFGIKGKRWDDNPTISALYNDSWVRPCKDERPSKLLDIEGGCYW